MNLRYVTGAVVALVAIAAGIQWYGRGSATHRGAAESQSAQPRGPEPNAEAAQPAQASGSAPAWAQKGYSASDAKFEGEAGDCNETCNHGAQIGETVAEMRIASAPPTPQGGTLMSGTYVVTEMTQYTGPNGEVGPTGLERSFTLRINATSEGATFDSAYVHTVDECVKYWQGGTMLTSGTWMKISITCWTKHPVPQEVVVGFTATEDKLVAFNTPSSTVTFVRQR